VVCRCLRRSYLGDKTTSMRITIYDKNPGPGFAQWFLKLTWFIGCWFQKRVGAVDKYYGAASWDDAVHWMLEQPAPLTSIQYWGHGSPGLVYLSGVASNGAHLSALAPKVTPETVLWLRACSVFQGAQGHTFSKMVSNALNCTVAGHTRIIGPCQGGLHTRKPNTTPSWPITEAEPPATRWPNYLKWGPNTVTCLATKIPDGW
jgi:hypothetical protein